MNKQGIMVAAFVLTFAILVCSSAQAQPSGVIPGQFIVVLDDDVADAAAAAQDLAARHGLVLGHTYRAALNGFSARIPVQRLAAVQADARVKFIEPDLVVHAVKGPPPGKGGGKGGKEQPPQVIPTGIDRVNADLSAAAKIDGIDERVDVDIAILDTGISSKHPDLNCVRGVTVPGAGKGKGEDDHGHGTHVAGIAAAVDNDIGVVGVAPGARLWSVKVLNKWGSGSLSAVIAGIDWITVHADEVEVTNMSLSATGTSDAFRLAIQNSVAAGILYTAAAGNSGRDVYGYDLILGTEDDTIPAAYPEVAAISAIADSDGQPGGLGIPTSWGYDDTLAIFSNYSRGVVAKNPVTSPGAAIDLAAPGVDILSTWKGDGYATDTGTSMSAPHVCGAAGLYIAVNGKPADAAGVAAVRQALIDAGFPQSSPDGFTNDLDLNPEPLLNAGSP